MHAIDLELYENLQDAKAHLIGWEPSNTAQRQGSRHRLKAHF
jgi:hypothetical protein